MSDLGHTIFFSLFEFPQFNFITHNWLVFHYSLHIGLWGFWGRFPLCLGMFASVGQKFGVFQCWVCNWTNWISGFCFASMFLVVVAHV